MSDSTVPSSIAGKARSYKSGHAALRKGRASLPGQVYHLTVSTAGRRPWFLDFDAACAAAACFERKALLGDSQMMA